MMWWILAGMFQILALLLFAKAPTNFLWKVSVLVTEWAHYFAIVLGILSVVAFYKGNPSFWYLALLSLQYSYPVLAAFVLSKKIPAAFSRHFGSSQEPFRFSFIKLFQWKDQFGIQPRTMSYFSDETKNLQLDLYRNGSAEKQACVIVVHGGGWDSGDRKQLSELNYYLSSKGIAVASISYRLAPEHHFPAPLDDLRNARLFLTDKSKELGILENTFFYLGRSAGGQIALTEAYTHPDPSVKGVIAFYAPADMAWGYEFPCWKYVMDSRKVQRDYIGGTPIEKPGVYERASATHLVKAGLPPTLMLCGENDVLTSFHHNTRLIAKLGPAHVPYFLCDIPYGVHGFDFNFFGPSAQLSTWCVEQFVRRHT